MRRVHNSASVPGDDRLADRPRTQEVPDEPSATANAQVRFEVTEQSTQINVTRQPLDPVTPTAEAPAKGPQPTSAAEAQIHYREARGRLRVPDRRGLKTRRIPGTKSVTLSPLSIDRTRTLLSRTSHGRSATGNAVRQTPPSGKPPAGALIGIELNKY